MPTLFYPLKNRDMEKQVVCPGSISKQNLSALGSVMSILQNSPCCLHKRRKHFTQVQTVPFRKASEVERRVKERCGTVQADKQEIKG